MAAAANEQSIAAEVVAAVRKLTQGGSFLESLDAAGEYRLQVQGKATPGVCVSAAAVAEALSRGLVARHDNRVVVTEAGAKWVKRMLADTEPFRAQHLRLSASPSGRLAEAGKPLLNEAESPLAWLRRRKDKAGREMITQEQFAAGERLRSDFTFAGLEPRVTASWNAAGAATRQSRGPHGFEMREEVLAARERVQRALKAVGPELSGILLDVCCYLKGLEEVEREHAWPQRSGKLVLQFGLAALARHYGFGRSDRRGRIVHWGEDGYRPTLESWSE
jgi:hypothetical protein